LTNFTSTGLKQRVIFRADGNSRIGLGHVTRSLALAQMLKQEFECLFAIQAPNAELSEQILSICHGIIILPSCSVQEERFKHELDAYISEEEIVVLDGYNFETAYQQNVKSKGAVLVCLDDIHSYPFVADAVINQAGGVDASQYNLASYTKLYLGPAYALLRSPFLKNLAKSAPLTEVIQRIILCMGGADPENHTLKIAEKVHKHHKNVHLEIVTGSAYQHTQHLNAWLMQHKQHRLHHNLSAEGMASLMKGCPVAITSASGIAYEYAAVGGALYIHKTADNQNALYHYLIKSELARPFDVFSTEIDQPSILETIHLFKQRQRKVFDGKSGVRLKAIFTSLKLKTSLKIRPVNSDDLSLLFSWANDPEVRKNSFNTASIPMEIHSNWFNIKLNNPGSKLYIVEVQGQPAAHIRFELSGHTAVISYLISDAFRGKGLGHEVLQKGVKELVKDTPAIKQIEGLVQKSNIASVRAFEKADFKLSTPDDLFPDAVKFILQVNPNKLTDHEL
jgi:UDP-2,4-diacetamido-2,4,6-trideoxy-beta-L-altropyranose hydrolase